MHYNTCALIDSTKNKLGYLTPRASLITSSIDHLKKTKSRFSIHRSKQEVSGHILQQESTVSTRKQEVPKLVTNKEQIMQRYPDVFDGVECFLGTPYHIQVDPSITPKQTPCQPIPVYLKEACKQEIDKMLKVGVLKLVHKATPWINSLLLVKAKDKVGNLKLRICLDPNNLNKAIVRELYHFETPEDIAHLLVDACIMTLCDSKKGYWHQKLDKVS